MLKRQIGSLNERIGELNKENREHKTVTVQMASYMVGMLGKTKAEQQKYLDSIAVRVAGIGETAVGGMSDNVSDERNRGEER